MNEQLDRIKEQKRRKALADLRITKEVSQYPTMSSSKQFKNPNTATPDSEPKKENLVMIFLGGMLTVTSIILVSLCFFTTIGSYDRAVNEANVAPTIIANDNDGGPVVTISYPVNNRRMMNAFNNFPRARWRMMRAERMRM